MRIKADAPAAGKSIVNVPLVLVMFEPKSKTATALFDLLEL